ncbi:MAG TPA: sigma 54-interacting transcriptional regulator [Kofleriaceae bacterium]|nr:sigma 54-interacting transcriptional regulator [Kofleriaceae bacterium]
MTAAGGCDGPRTETVVRPAADRRLLVLCDGSLQAHALPANGEVQIGRSSEADVHVDHPSVSRIHAVLSLSPTLAVRDRSSHNGTRVGGQLLRADEVRAIAPGEAIELGSVTLIVQDRVDESAPAASTSTPSSGKLDSIDVAAERIARTSITVLILGETGAGKEVLAERLHALSPRAAEPLIKIHCAALPESLIESELFGHEKGAFTGADTTKPGRLESAHRGTVFLDEIGELAPAIQVKLLRVLEERAVWRVGALAARPIDVRFLAATNRDLEAEVAAGRFRADLYFRIAGASLRVPPLRERVNEIAPLAMQFAREAGERLGRPNTTLDPRALALLRAYAFPGNVRELRNLVERAVALADGPSVTVESFPPELAARPAAAGAPLSSAVDDFERKQVVEALAQAGGNQSRAAALLGISRRALVTRLSRYGMTRPRKRAR